MQFLFPSDPFDKKKPDDAYWEEYQHAKALGINCSLFSFEDFEQGEFKEKPQLLPNEPVIYRGWMLTIPQYADLFKAVKKRQTSLITTPIEYQLCHHLPGWYSECQEFTAETVVLPQDSDFEQALRSLNWTAYFVKDYVKSLGTQNGSIAYSPAEVSIIVQQIQQRRGFIEGGVCVRQFEEFVPNTEQRYFVYNGVPKCDSDVAPIIVASVAKRIRSPFFTIDVAQHVDGGWRVIELGDGQVSDRKHWPVDKFFEIFNK